MLSTGVVTFLHVLCCTKYEIWQHGLIRRFNVASVPPLDFCLLFLNMKHVNKQILTQDARWVEEGFYNIKYYAEIVILPKNNVASLHKGKLYCFNAIRIPSYVISLSQTDLEIMGGSRPAG